MRCIRASAAQKGVQRRPPRAADIPCRTRSLSRKGVIKTINMTSVNIRHESMRSASLLAPADGLEVTLALVPNSITRGWATNYYCMCLEFISYRRSFFVRNPLSFNEFYDY